MESSSDNTYVFDSESSLEIARLINQDRMMTQAMDGPLSGIADPTSLQNILDLGCGPGGWVLDVAFACPDANVEGVDISRLMIDYANARARTQQLPNASFGVMDITNPLEFPDTAFDVVNARFLTVVLKREAWPLFLKECTRVLRPGGLLRLTEVVDAGVTNSTAVNQLMALFTQTLWQAGYAFSPDGHSVGMIHMLPSFLRELEYQQVRLLPHALEYSADMEAWADQFHNIEVAGFQMKYLLVKEGLITAKAFDQLYSQALIDMQQNTFRAVQHLTTVLGKKPAAS
jgi:ubiquinone/menaquinone biosynthesis C-methylase UbiE